MSRKRKLTAMALTFLLVICVIIAPILYGKTQTEVIAQTKDTSVAVFTGEKGQSGRLTGSGVTEAGTKKQVLETDLSFQLALAVEEVFVTAGDTVEEGDALYRFTEDSLNSAVSWLQREQVSAKTSLDTAKADYDSGVLQAEYQKQADELLGSTAESQYNAELAVLQQEVDAAQKAIASADEKIASYTEKLNNNAYAEKYDLDALFAAQDEKAKEQTAKETVLTEKQKAYETVKAEAEPLIQTLQQELANMQEELSQAKSAYEEALNALLTGVLGEETMDVDTKALAETVKTTKSAAESLEADITAKESVLSEQETRLKEAQSAVQNAEQDVQSAKLACQQALNEYNQGYSACSQATEKAQTELTSLQNNYENLTIAYQEALLKQTNQTLALKERYDSDMLTSKNAAMVYELTVESLTQAVTEAQETYDQVTVILKRIQNIAETGCVTAEYAGVLTDVPYETDNFVFGTAVLVTYLDSTHITVDISVAQEDIAKLSVGQEVQVAVAGVTYNGTVKEISSTKESGGSVSSVNYTVTIEISDENGSASVGQSATVLFTTAKTEE